MAKQRPTPRPKKKDPRARPCVFEGKHPRTRLQGIMRKIGRQRFEQHRIALAGLYKEIMGETIRHVSDGDTVEYLAIGADETKTYLRDRLALSQLLKKAVH